MRKLVLILNLVVALMLPNFAEAGSLKVVKNITAQNICSDPLALGKVSGAVLTLSGTWVATVTIQRQDILGDWGNVTSNDGSLMAFTGNGTYSVYEPTLNANYRFCVATGSFTSGTVAGVLEYN